MTQISKGRFMSTQQNTQALYLEPERYKAAHLELVKDTQLNDLSILEEFESHSLEQQNSAALMNRMDSKYVLPLSLFTPMMKEISQDYSILTSNEKKIFNYQTTYFDNKERQFYLDHHNGKLNRFKVRFRRYVESDIGFMEVKFKNNKKRTIKQRIPTNSLISNYKKVNEFINNTLGYTANLQTTLFVNYQRITLLNKHSLERITIDLNLRFRDATNKKQSLQDQVFIVEIKRQGKSLGSTCNRFLKNHGYKETNFSKYCMGCILTHSCKGSVPLKSNRFKPILHKLDKLNNPDKYAHSII